MGMLDFLKGEKKAGEPGKLPDLNLAPLPEMNLGDQHETAMGNMGNIPSFESNPAFNPSQQESPPFHPSQFQQHPTYPTQQQTFPASTSQQASFPSADKDVQLIISKLDTIRAELDSMNQRVIRIERIAEQSIEPPVKQQLQKRFNW
ncbi:MAG: hypothetical protein V1743_07760 [Nanoarchaeota archaeon]